MKILLTGATGFVGRNFLLKLLAENAYDEIVLPIRNPEKLKTQLREEGYTKLPEHLRLVEASAPDWGRDEWEVDHVVHAAGILMASNRQQYDDINVTGTLNLLAKLKHARKVIVLSSHAAAGPCPAGTRSKNELDSDDPVTWYGQSKLEMEAQVRSQFPTLPCIFLRPPMILGARDSASLPLFVLGKQWIQVKPGFKEKLYSFIAVDDLVSALQVALADPTPWGTPAHPHYFVCAKEPVSDRSLLLGAAATFDRAGRIVPIPHWIVRAVSTIVGLVPAWSRKIPNLSPDRAHEIWPDRWVVSPEAFENRFKWTATWDLTRTLQATQRWYLRTGLL